jgi:Bacterial protein of unknown function (DUF922)
MGKLPRSKLLLVVPVLGILILSSAPWLRRLRRWRSERRVLSRGDIPAGRDLLRTARQGATFSFADIPIPAGFFDDASQAFTKAVRFHGRPLPRSFFNGHAITHVDTIVDRPESVELPQPYPQSRTTPIELIGLALESSDPIEVETATATELWDVHVELSTSRPSAGTMTIRKTHRHGGVFDSEFTVFPVFRFRRQRDGRERVLDVGALPMSPELIDKVTLRSRNSSWVHFASEKLTVAGLNDTNFVPGVRKIDGIALTRAVPETDDGVDELAAVCAHSVSTPPACPPTEVPQINKPSPVRRTFPVGGETLRAVARRLNRREEWGLTVAKPTYSVKTCEGRVFSVTITLPITVDLPRWTRLAQAGPNSRAEWQRMLDALRDHENNHVSIFRRHFDDALGRSMLNRSKSSARQVFDAAKANAKDESQQYDAATNYGRTEGVYLDVGITD